MRKIYLLVFLYMSTIGHSLFAQPVLQVDTVDLWDIQQDTLYFNKQGYGLVKTVKYTQCLFNKNVKKYGYLFQFYVIANDTLNWADIEEWVSRLYKGLITSSDYRKSKCKCSSGGGFGIIGLYKTLTVRCEKNKLNFVPAPLTEAKILMEKKADANNGHISLSIHFLDNVKRFADSLSLLLNYENKLSYYMSFVSDSGGTHTSLLPSDECSNYMVVKNDGQDIQSVRQQMQTLVLPVLKIHHKPHSYSISEGYNFNDYLDAVIGYEKKHDFPNSSLLFPDNPDIFFLKDSFHHMVIVYPTQTVALKDEHERAYILYNTIGLKKEYFLDLDADGRTDFVLDTLSNQTDDYHIYYIANKYPLDREDDLKQKFGYTRYLGNGYYYDFYNGTHKSAGFIFYMNDGEKCEVLSYHKFQLSRRSFSKKRGKWRWRGRGIKWKKTYRYTYLNVKNKKKLQITTSTQKAIKWKTEAVYQLYYYIQHPELLPIDFPKK